MMKQINNGFLPCYYITEKGIVVNEKFNRDLKASKKHLVKLTKINGERKETTIKTL